MNAKFIAGFSTLSLVFLALFVPITYKEVKILFLSTAILSSLLLATQLKNNWDRKTLYAFGILSCYGFINSVYGSFNDNPGAIRVLTVMSLWPLLYAFLTININNSNALKAMNKTLWLALICIVLYSFLFLANKAGIAPDFLYFELNQGQIVGFYDGFIEYNLYSISSLLFLVPFAFHQAYLSFQRNTLSIRIIVLLVFVIFLVILTGRRAVQLILILTPFLIISSKITLGIKKSINCNRKDFLISFYKNIFILFSCIATFFLFKSTSLDVESLWLVFLDGFDFKNGNSASERTAQLHSLTQAWLNGNIIFGSGNGAKTELIRSYTQPWAYELTYVYLLFSTGLVGVLFYFGWFTWGLLRLRKELRKNPEIIPLVAPIISGVFGLSIGAATNPYFGKFDYLWIIMLPHLLAGGIKYQRIDQ